MRQPSRIVVQIGRFNLGSQGFCIIISLFSNQKRSFGKGFLLFYKDKKTILYMRVLIRTKVLMAIK